MYFTFYMYQVSNVFGDNFRIQNIPSEQYSTLKTLSSTLLSLPYNVAKKTLQTSYYLEIYY